MNQLFQLFVGKNLNITSLFRDIFHNTFVSLILNYITGLGVPKELNLNLFVTFISLLIVGALLLWPAVLGRIWIIAFQDRLFYLSEVIKVLYWV